MKKFIRLSLLAAILLFKPDFLSAQSPYKISREKDSYILGAGIASTLTGYLVYHSVSSPAPEEINQLHKGSINWFDRSATYKYSEPADKTSDILVGIAAAAPLFLLMDQKIENDKYTIALMYLEVWSFIGGTSMLSKGTITRYRPYIYNPQVPADKKLNPDAKMSFFSNHTAAAFASAVFISTVYSDYNPSSKLMPYIWAGSLLAASTIGYFRYEAGMHYPTDIIAGAVIGSAIGYIIPWMHRTKNEGISVAPYSRFIDYGISIQAGF
jgi:hypothetical protein